MIAHASINVSNYETAKLFYKTVLANVGYEFTADHPEWKAGGYMEGGQTSFWIAQREAPITEGHVAFEAKNKEQVEAFYKAALEAGAKDNGAPGYRKEYWTGYYAAFVHDVDGNNIEAVWFDYDAK